MTEITLAANPPFDFCNTVRSHGWYQLAPNAWNETGQRLERAAVNSSCSTLASFQSLFCVDDACLAEGSGGFKAIGHLPW